MKIKDIPNDDRPYERCLREGPERLSDTELLSILLRTGSKELNSLELASSILALNYPTPVRKGSRKLSRKEVIIISKMQKIDIPINIYLLRFDSIYNNPRSFILT